MSQLAKAYAKAATILFIRIPFVVKVMGCLLFRGMQLGLRTPRLYLEITLSHGSPIEAHN